MSDRENEPHAAEPAKQADETQRLSPLERARAGDGWRASLYRVPVLGAAAYVVAPPRSGPPTLPRRVASWASVVVAVLGIGMVAYPWAGHLYPAPYRIPVEKGIEWSNFLSDREANTIQANLKKTLAAAPPVIAA